MIFSFSRLNLYEQCPYRFYQKYVLGKEEPVTLPLALGKAVHQAISDKINGISHTEAILNGYMEAEFHKELIKKDISDLVERAPIQPKMGDIEVYFKFPLSDEPNAPELQGYIDLCTSDGAITDWKTNRIPYDVLDNKQFPLYAWAIRNQKGWDTVEGILYFLRFRKEKSHVFTIEEMEKARMWALDTAKEINERVDLVEVVPNEVEKIFPPQPSRLCGHCPFAYDCIINHSETV